MNYLQLTNTLRQEAGVQGNPLVTLQSGLSLEGTRCATWVNQAWVQIQRLREDWNWMRYTAAFTTTNFTITGSISGNVLTVTATNGVLSPGQSVVSSSAGNTILANTQILTQTSGTAGSTGTYTVNINQTVVSTTIQIIQQSYTPAQVGLQALYNSGPTITAANFKNWIRASFRASTVASNFGDEQLINFMPWPIFRNLYVYGQMRGTSQRPVVVSVDPQKNIWFGPIPDPTQYVINFEWQIQPVELSADTDTPLLNQEDHYGIVWKALEYYGFYESAPEVIQRAQKEYAEWKGKVTIDQIQMADNGPALA